MIYQNACIFIKNVVKPCNNQLDIRPIKEIGNCYMVLTTSTATDLSSTIDIRLNYRYRCRLIVTCSNIK